MPVSISDDYASGEFQEYKFYYGYERTICPNHGNDLCSCDHSQWAFVVTNKKDEEVYRCTADVVKPKTKANLRDYNVDPAYVLLLGMMFFGQHEKSLLERRTLAEKVKKQKLLRVRFLANRNDYRPVKWPIKHPYWCTGYDDKHAIVVAYADNIEYIKEHWPEAVDIDATEVKGYSFTSRFPKPEWFTEPKKDS
jgi:hypothetical protein